MNGEEQDDIETLAGEYVLGVLDAADRRAIAARRIAEPALDAAIARWEQRLAPLSAFVAEEAPPPDVFARIEREIEAPAGADMVTLLSARARRWKIAALTSGALAASLAVALISGAVRQSVAPNNFVAVLQKDAGSPAFVVSVDLRTRELTVRPIEAVAPAGKSYELWLINDRLDAPKSLGVIEKADFTRRETLRAFPPELLKTSLFAVTVEPAGGSPTGKPSAAPVFAGKLFQSEP
ncbi:anti-sigma factor [uncultured Rhodoblastus sp.]|uniref:anti-sigma factor n=1 Tax=uncultured Rhodoblastus sp. TaxID=543037 RepID=UPI0025FF8C4F|nr:anti-sigma factor [uncultured Rhodoblastus sp.]